MSDTKLRKALENSAHKEIKGEMMEQLFSWYLQISDNTYWKRARYEKKKIRFSNIA